MSPNSKHIKTLEKLLKLPENKECADCRSKAPRWASINLGSFICLQCSGIHRSLGVHVSKVRSVTLDTWLPEQVSYMQSMGNDKSNAYWEAKLPLHYDRGQIENFIRAKYAERRWIAKDRNVKPPSKSNQELISSRSLRCYGSNGLTSSRSSRLYGNNGLTSSRSSRRYGSIAEWTNSQHLFLERRDCSVGDKDRAGSNPGTDEVPKDLADSKNQHQNLEKKENCQPQPSMDQSAPTNLRSVNGKPSKEPAQVVCTLGANGNLRKSEEGGLKIKPSTANPSPKVDYADELFRTLYVENSVGIDSSLDTNEWVRFDSYQESSTAEAKSCSKVTVAKAIQEVEFTPRSAASNINAELKKEDTQTAITTGHLNDDQKEFIKNEQNLSKKPNMVSSSSIHLQRLGMLAQSVSSTDAPKLPSNVSGYEHQLSVNGGSVERTRRTQMPMQNYQPVKSAVSSAPYTLSSLDRPAAPFKGVTSMPSARQSSAALPVSGYDYDFSFLTKGMFTKR